MTTQEKEITFGEFKQDIPKGLEIVGKTLYLHNPYEIISNEGCVMTAGSLEELLTNFITNHGGYYDHCIFRVRTTDYYLNDNTRKA